MAKKPIGTVTHYFGKPKVGIVALAGRVATGDTVRFLGHGADFKQKIKSMQMIHRHQIKKCKKIHIPILF